MAASTDSRLPWRVPVMQAPIGPAATPALAAAVSEAGGIGSLGASWTEAGELRSQIREIRQATDGPFGVNLVLAFEQEERLEIALAEGVELILFSWGVRADLVAASMPPAGSSWHRPARSRRRTHRPPPDATSFSSRGWRPAATCRVRRPCWRWWASSHRRWPSP